MNKQQAYEQGLHYTGMSFESWDKEDGEYYAKKVREYKEKYNVRLVKVKLHDGWVSYFGDDNFSLIQYDSFDTLQNKLNNIPNRIEQAKKEYEECLSKIEKDKADIISKMEKVKAIMKGE